MNAKSELITQDADVELISTALQHFDRVSAGLALLEKNYKGVLYEVDTPMGMAHAKAARAAIRDPRYEVEKVRKSAKAPLLSLGKRVDSTALRITNALLDLEVPIDDQIKAEEQRKEDEKNAKIAAEAKRVADIQARIQSIRDVIVEAARFTADLIAESIDEVKGIAIDDSFAEFQQAATDAKDATLGRLAELHSAALAADAERARIKAEREELAELRAVIRIGLLTEQAERDRLAREEQARADAAARQVREREEAEQRERLRQERQENERIASERRAELDRQEAEARKVRDAETARLAAERAELEAQQRAANTKPTPPKTKGNPGARALTQVIADHFEVNTSIARNWLAQIDWDTT